ncbi:hypothetical protein [Nocardiopsis synnemataformans]|uniref:hypothetical protein n=1 Tax=Nocardiopsis synnemataformans TaxID=61305 RepID=UPI003EBA08DD
MAAQLRTRRGAVGRHHRRAYAAEDLHKGMFVVDPDGRLGLHAAKVRVAEDSHPLDRYDTSNVVVDWEIPGTNVTGRFSAPRLAPVWVVGGDGR